MMTRQMLNQGGLFGVAANATRQVVGAMGRTAVAATKFGASVAGPAVWGGAKAAGRGIGGLASRQLFGPSMASQAEQTAAQARVLDADNELAAATREAAAATNKGTAAKKAAEERYIAALDEVDAALAAQAVATSRMTMLSGGPSGMGRVGGALGFGRSRFATGMNAYMIGSIAGSMIPGQAGKAVSDIGMGAAIGSLILPGYGTVAGGALGGLYAMLHSGKPPPGATMGAGPGASAYTAAAAAPGAGQASARTLLNQYLNRAGITSQVLKLTAQDRIVTREFPGGLNLQKIMEGIQAGGDKRGKVIEQLRGLGLITGEKEGATPYTPKITEQSLVSSLQAFQTGSARGTVARAKQQTNLGSTPLGGVLGTSPLFQSVAFGKLSGNFGAQERAVEQASAAAVKLAGGADKATTGLQKVADAAGGSAGALAQAAAQRTRQISDFNLPYQSRSQQLATLSQRAVSSRQVARANPASQADQDQAQNDAAAFQGDKQSYTQYLQSVYQQTRDFGIQMARANQDYHIQVSRTNRDFERSEERAQADYNRSRAREIADFNRQQLYSQQDYQLQVKYTTQDFHTQMRREAEEAAKTIYNPFQEVQAQQVAGAAGTLYDLTDQNRRIGQQLSQLRQAKKLGLSTQSLKELDLANPQNAQQLNAIVEQLSTDPKLAGQINKQVGIRVKGTAALTQSTLNTTFSNSIEDFRRGLDRGARAYRTSQDRAKTQQGITLTQMAQDYHTMTGRMTKDENTALGDMASDYSRTVKQTVGDMTREMTDLYGSFATNSTRAIDKINTVFGKYAPKLAATLVREINAAKTAIGVAAGTGDPLLGAGTGVAAVAPSAAVIPGSANQANERRIVTALSNAGVNAMGIAGIVGNLQQESEFSPTAGKGTAHQGIAQVGQAGPASRR